MALASRRMPRTPMIGSGASSMMRVVFLHGAGMTLAQSGVAVCRSRNKAAPWGPAPPWQNVPLQGIGGQVTGGFDHRVGELIFATGRILGQRPARCGH
jgi:hypothetical protein